MKTAVAYCLALLVQPTGAAELLVVGNSIALHPASPSIGWDHQSGMAASSEALDYAHLLAAKTGSTLEVVNYAFLERGESAFNGLPIKADTKIVVVQLGDNVSLMANFLPAYKKLLAATKGTQLICVSSWWRDFSKDAAIFDACTASGGEYVYIGDLFLSSANSDRSLTVYKNTDVSRHPQNWGMARIAERIKRAIH